MGSIGSDGLKSTGRDRIYSSTALWLWLGVIGWLMSRFLPKLKASLAIELLGAVAIHLSQRYIKSWSSAIIVKIKGSSSSLKAGLSEVPKLHDRTATVSSTSPEGRNYQKGLVALAKNSASKWIEDKCPQLGAALAY